MKVYSLRHIITEYWQKKDMKLLSKRNLQLINILVFITLVSIIYVCISFYYTKDLTKTNAKIILKNYWINISTECSNEKTFSCYDKSFKKFEDMELKFRDLKCYFCKRNNKIDIKLLKYNYVNENLFKLGLERTADNKLKKRQKKTSEKFKFLTIPTFNKEYFSFIVLSDNNGKNHILYIEYKQTLILLNIILSLIIFIIFPYLIIISFFQNGLNKKSNIFNIALSSKYFAFFVFIGFLIYRFLTQFFYKDYSHYIDLNFNPWVQNSINLNKNIELVIYSGLLCILFLFTIYIIKTYNLASTHRKSIFTFGCNCMQFISIVFCIYHINNGGKINFVESLVYCITFVLFFIKKDLRYENDK